MSRAHGEGDRADNLRDLPVCHHRGCFCRFPLTLEGLYGALRAVVSGAVGAVKASLETYRALTTEKRAKLFHACPLEMFKKVGTERDSDSGGRKIASFKFTTYFIKEKVP